MFRLAPLLVTAAAVSDETSLMQGVKPQQKLKEDKSRSVSTLLETAKTMLKNGATPDVVNFTQATLAEITDVVLPKIEDSHAADQRLVTETHSMFADAIADLIAGIAVIEDLQDAEVVHREAHKKCRGLEADSIETCRAVSTEDCGFGLPGGADTWVEGECATEHCACENKRDCDYELWSIWKHFQWEEILLREKSKEIENHFCVEGANGTLWNFRDHAVTQFPPWIAQKTVVEGWEEKYGAWVPECRDRYEIMDATTSHCDGIQTHLEEASCALFNKVVDVNNQFSQHWEYAARTYQTLIDEVHCLEIDRWKEWRSLATVQCLLERTQLRNGRPCDDHTSEFEQESAECERIQVDENIDHLRIFYPAVPEFPDPPSPVPEVCDRDWEVKQDYPLIWSPPEPEFKGPDEKAGSHSDPDYRFRVSSGLMSGETTTTPTELATLRGTGNSHCNDRLDCTRCVHDNPVPACAVMAAHIANNQPWVREVNPDDECMSVTGRQMQEGQFDRNDDGHFTRGGTHPGPTIEDPMAAPPSTMQD